MTAPRTSNQSRVTGPPGTGKTQFLARQVEAWCSRDGYEPADVVLCSLTNTAAAVLKGRIPVPEQQVATLHALAYRSLGKPPLAETDDLADQWNDSPCPPGWKLAGFEMEEGLPPQDRPGAMMALYSLWRGGMRQDRMLELTTAGFAKQWEQFKRDTASYDWNDLLEVVLSRGVPLCYHPRAFVVDEYQDCTPLLAAVAEWWGSRAESYVVAGDPAQVLYGFTGAVPDTMLMPLPGPQTRLLAQSYRLPSSVHSLAERWLAGHSGGIMAGREYRAQEEIGAVERVRGLTPEHAERLADMAGSWAELGLRTMVLTCCRYQLSGLTRELRVRGVAFGNPYRPEERNWNPLVDGGGRKTTPTIRRARALRAGPVWDKEQVALWAELLRETAWQKGQKSVLLGREDGVTVHELHHYLQPSVAEAVAAENLAALLEHGYQKHARVLEYAAAVWSRGGDLDAEPLVVPGTIHSVKGGEADVVILLPHPSPAGERELATLLGRDAYIRQVYVGMTRARQVLVVGSGEPETRQHRAVPAPLLNCLTGTNGEA